MPFRAFKTEIKLDDCVSVTKSLSLKLEYVLHTKRNCCSFNEDDGTARDWISCHNVSLSKALLCPHFHASFCHRRLCALQLNRYSHPKKNMEGMSWCVCFAHIFFSFSLFRHFLLANFTSGQWTLLKQVNRSCMCSRVGKNWKYLEFPKHNSYETPTLTRINNKKIEVILEKWVEIDKIDLPNFFKEI